MKRLFPLVLFALLHSSGTKAQTFDEWFRQSATQKKYLLQQIAGLQVYIGYVQKGYSIASLSGKRIVLSFASFTS